MALDRAKSARRSGVVGVHVHLLPARQSAVAGHQGGGDAAGAIQAHRSVQGEDVR